MNVVKPSVQVMGPVDGEEILKRLEAAGRVCWKSEDRTGTGTAAPFVAGIIRRGHEAVLEHASLTVKFTVDRGVSHEIVRHRLASYCQESTRYCSYAGEKFGHSITAVEPPFFNPERENGAEMREVWEQTCRQCEDAYFRLLELGASPQEARTVLPNSLKTELFMTANLREWRHFLRLRCAPAAHPQMREAALDLLEQMHALVPVVFDDIWEEFLGARDGAQGDTQ